VYCIEYTARTERLDLRPNVLPSANNCPQFFNWRVHARDLEHFFPLQHILTGYLANAAVELYFLAQQTVLNNDNYAVISAI